MLDFETVSQGNRHRSNHTQNEVPSIVAVHQSLQSGCKGPDSGMFPITVWHIQASAWTNSLFSQLVLTRLPLQDLLFGLWCFHDACSSSSRRYVSWEELSQPLLLFSKGSGLGCHSRQEWHSWSHRLHHSFWQENVDQIFIWNNWGALYSASLLCQSNPWWGCSRQIKPLSGTPFKKVNRICRTLGTLFPSSEYHFQIFRLRKLSYDSHHIGFLSKFGLKYDSCQGPNNCTRTKTSWFSKRWQIAD